jgi:uroporphyrinogen decarboxylase
MRFGPVDRVPLWEWHFLEPTVERWHQEGLPANVILPTGGARGVSAPEVLETSTSIDSDVIERKEIDAAGRASIGSYFQLDRGEPYCAGEVAYVPVSTGIMPPFEERLLHEDERTRVLVDANGITKEIHKHISPAMPRFLEYPVRSREDFATLRKRFDSAAKRYPSAAVWQGYKASIQRRDYPLGLMFDGFFGRLRNWMGTEGLMYTLYDSPAFFEEMCESHCQFISQTIRQAVEDVKIDYVNIWEDMAYKSGPLISPKHVRQYMLPRYRLITDMLHAHGVEIIFVDSDGNLDELIPIWLQAGINGVWPLEVAAGSDLLALRELYGKDLLLVGGIDKRELSKGKAEVYAEVMRQVPTLNAQGGYITTVDHSVPPDVPLENYVYYRDLLQKLAYAI